MLTSSSASLVPRPHQLFCVQPKAAHGPGNKANPVQLQYLIDIGEGYPNIEPEIALRLCCNKRVKVPLVLVHYVYRKYCMQVLSQG